MKQGTELKRPAPVAWIIGTAVVTCLMTLLLQAEYRRLSGPFFSLIGAGNGQAEAKGLSHFDIIGLSLASNGRLPYVARQVIVPKADGLLVFGTTSLPIRVVSCLRKYEPDFRMSSTPTLVQRNSLLINRDLVETLNPSARKVMTARIEGGIYVCWIEVKDLDKLPNDGVLSIIVN